MLLLHMHFFISFFLLYSSSFSPLLLLFFVSTSFCDWLQNFLLPFSTVSRVFSSLYPFNSFHSVPCLPLPSSIAKNDWKRKKYHAFVYMCCVFMRISWRVINMFYLIRTRAAVFCFLPAFFGFSSVFLMCCILLCFIFFFVLPLYYIKFYVAHSVEWLPGIRNYWPNDHHCCSHYNVVKPLVCLSKRIFSIYFFV